MFYKYAGMQVFSAVHLAVIKDHNICLIRMVVLASAGALMDVMVQEDATPGVRATQRRYTTEYFLHNMSLDFDHQTCGGRDSNTVYGTGFSLPGPPTTLNMISATTTSIYINWTSPISTNGQLDEYQVSLTLLSSHHPTSGRRSPLLQRFSASADSARLGDLLPGSKYKLEVSAVSQEGVGPSISK